MGIGGLTTFISTNHPRVGEDVPLDTPQAFIIDGNSLVHHLALCFDWSLGAHYGQLAWLLQDKSRQLACARGSQHSLTFVFDGPLPAYKVSERLKRNAQKVERLQLVVQAALSGTVAGAWSTFAVSNLLASAASILPPMTMNLAVHSLKEAGYNVVVSEIDEADAHIARLARESNGIVLSRDSDFYVLDVPYFVPIDVVFPIVIGQLSRPPSSELSIADAAVQGAADLTSRTVLRAVNRSHLADAMRIHPDHLPLLAVLAGYDLGTDPSLETLFASLQLHINRKKWPVILSLLRPLSCIPVESAISSLSKRMASSARLQGKLTAAFEAAVLHFGKHPDTNLTQISDAAASADPVPTSPVSVDPFLATLKTLASNGSVHSRLIEVYRDHVFWGPPSLEDDYKDSAWKVSLPIRQLAYVILGCEPETPITEHWRKGDSMGSSAVLPETLPAHLNLASITTHASWKHAFATLLPGSFAESCSSLDSMYWPLVLALRYIIDVRYKAGQSVGNHELNAWVCAGTLALHRNLAHASLASAHKPVFASKATPPVTRASLHDFAQLESTLNSMLLLFQAGLARCALDTPQQPPRSKRHQDLGLSQHTFWACLDGPEFHLCMDMARKGAAPDQIVAARELSTSPSSADLASVVQQVLSACADDQDNENSKIEIVVDYTSTTSAAKTRTKKPRVKTPKSKALGSDSSTNGSTSKDSGSCDVNSNKPTSSSRTLTDTNAESVHVAKDTEQ
ncbi:hypothetical protein BC831DRAFT_453880 [Entophlyctis helioformis]|nr:hypothetical protein BC831DRAFT_453880 [Entophlyctis helioformis]